MGFDDVRFPVNISYGSVGGPGYLTDVVVSEGGTEDRAQIWPQSKNKYNVAYGVREEQDIIDLQTFFHARAGKTHSFRYKDFLNFLSTQTVLPVTGAPTVQLIYNYTSGPRTQIKTIRKPISATFTMRRNTSPFAAFTLNDQTGVVTLTPDATSSIASGAGVAITDITQANPGVVTTGAVHNLTTGDYVRITGVVGMTEVNDTQFQVTVLTTTTFEIVNTTSFTAYDSGGTMVNIGISQSNPGVVRSVAHGLTTSDVVWIRSVAGMTEVNDAVYTVTVIDVDHFSIGVDTTTFTLYTASGVVESHIQPSEVLDWSGEFDFPCRFDIDELPASLDDFSVSSINSVPLIEVLNE